MALDLLSLPRKLGSLDSVSPEYRALYQSTDDGFALTPTAVEDFARISDGVHQLAEQRDKANAALLDAALMSAVMMNGVSGPMASAASCVYLKDHAISVAKGVPVVVTDLGNVDLKEAIAAWISTGGGRVFLPTENHFARQHRRVNS
jgi:hypothetical protein